MATDAADQIWFSKITGHEVELPIAVEATAGQKFKIICTEDMSIPPTGGIHTISFGYRVIVPLGHVGHFYSIHDGSDGLITRCRILHPDDTDEFWTTAVNNGNSMIELKKGTFMGYLQRKP